MKKKLYTLGISLLIFVFWLVCFILNKKEIDSTLTESIELLVIGAGIAGLLIFIDDIFYPAVIICYMPFVFSRSLTVDKTPIPLLISGGLIVAGLIIKTIKYKVKLKSGNLSVGLIAFAISFITGGIGNKDNELLGLQLLLCTLIAIALFLLYTLLVSSVKNIAFEDLCDTMNCLALLLGLQVFTYFLLNWNGLQFKNYGQIVGWGAANNVSLMLLLCMPFAFYRFCYGSRKFDLLYILVLYLELFIIIIVYSRGCILFGALGVIYMTLFTVFRQKKKCIRTLAPLLTIGIIGVIFLITDKELFNKIVSNVSNNIFSAVNFSNGNGRFNIYKDYFPLLKEHFIFGYGTFYPLLHSVDVPEGTYQWAHNTFLQAQYTLGIIGLLALTWHMVEKYYSVIHKTNAKKHAIFLSYFLSGLYGLIDVSYFFINYMIVLFIMFVFTEEYTDRINYRIFKAKENSQ